MKVRLFLFLLPIFAAAMENPDTKKVQQFSFQTAIVEKLSDKISRQYFYGQNEMIARFVLKKGAVIPKHNLASEQISYILSGSVKVTTNDTVYMVSSGEVLIIPPNVPYMFEALEDTIDIDVFSPPRQDWIEGNDNYLKQGSTTGAK